MQPLNRRRFLCSTGIGIGLAAIGSSRAAEKSRTRVDEKDRVRHALTGPISSIGTPFRRDGDIDYPNLRKIIDACIAGGSRTVLLTAGDSHYFCLSDDEISEVTKVTAQHVAGRAMVVAADRQYGTKRAIDFAKFARGVGADVVMCLPPDWDASGTAETLSEHYARVSEHAPVMIVTGVLGSRGNEFGLKTIKLALDASPNIVAIKDDSTSEFARRLCLMAHERCAVFAGGQKENHMNMWPYGCDGYMSVFVGIAPAVAHQYWSAIERKDIAAARRVIQEIDMPFFDFIIGMTGGFDAALHGMREMYGLGTRWRRKPYYSLNDAEMDKLRAFLATLKIPQPA